MEQDAVIRELQVELMRATEERDKWRKVADLYYESHENRRSCSLIARCKKCDAYEKALSGEQTV